MRSKGLSQQRRLWANQSAARDYGWMQGGRYIEVRISLLNKV